MAGTQEVIEVLTGHWGQGDYVLSEYDDEGNVGDWHFCLVGAAGKAFHDDAEFFDGRDLYDEGLEDDRAWIETLAEYLLRTDERLARMKYPGDLANLETWGERYARGAAFATDVVIVWNDHVADTEAEVLAVLAAFEAQR